MSNSTEVSDQSFVFSLHSMAEDILLYLREEELINPEEVAINLKQLLIDSSNSTEIYLSNMAIFLKTLILTVNKDSSKQEEKYINKIGALRKRFETFITINNQ